MRPKLSLQEMSSYQQTLIDIAHQAMSLEKAILDAKGELSPELESLLEVNSQTLSAKIDAYVHVDERLDALEGLWKKKAESLIAVSKGFGKARERLKERIKAVMVEMGKDEIKGSDYRYKLTRTKAKCVIDNEGGLPSEYKVQVVESKPDKEGIRKALEDGIDVPGAHLEESVALRVYENNQE